MSIFTQPATRETIFEGEITSEKDSYWFGRTFRITRDIPSEKGPLLLPSFSWGIKVEERVPDGAGLPSWQKLDAHRDEEVVLLAFLTRAKFANR